MKFYFFFFLSYVFSEKNENLLSFSSSEFGTAQKFIHHLAKSLLENQPRLKSSENLESSYISSQSFIDNIFDYGCWCQMSDELLKFRRGPGTAIKVQSSLITPKSERYNRPAVPELVSLHKMHPHRLFRLLFAGIEELPRDLELLDGQIRVPV